MPGIDAGKFRFFEIHHHNVKAARFRWSLVGVIFKVWVYKKWPPIGRRKSRQKRHTTTITIFLDHVTHCRSNRNALLSKLFSNEKNLFALPRSMFLEWKFVGEIYSRNSLMRVKIKGFFSGNLVNYLYSKKNHDYIKNINLKY